jgi:hypothetical protein
MLADLKHLAALGVQMSTSTTRETSGRRLGGAPAGFPRPSVSSPELARRVRGRHHFDGFYVRLHHFGADKFIRLCTQARAVHPLRRASAPATTACRHGPPSGSSAATAAYDNLWTAALAASRTS